MLKRLNQFVQEQSSKKYSFITANGTSAIYLALKASELPKGSKIAVPNIACPDPVYALIWARYKPVFIDVNINDYNIDVNSLKKKLNEDKNIKGIIAIHLFGNSCDIVRIKKLAKEYNCFLLEDCAQALGNEIEEGKLGSFGDVSIFSFGNGKIIEVGHGGSVHSNDKKLMNKIKIEYNKLKIHDQKEIEKLSKFHRSVYYKLYYMGVKYPILNILNLVYVYYFKKYYLYQFDHMFLENISVKFNTFEIDKEKRIGIISQYIDALKDFDNIVLPQLNNKKNILSRFTINIRYSEEYSKRIREKKISSNTMYPILVDRFKLFFSKKDYPNSYKLKGKLLNLWTSSIENIDVLKTIKILRTKINDN